MGVRDQGRGPNGGDDAPFTPDLHESEQRDVVKRTAVRAHVVHEAIRSEGEDELKRSSAALAWSGLAAGLSMGFSLVTEGLIRSRLPDELWRPFFAKLGYSAGFLLVILGRQQLFTENTLTAILPLLARRDLKTFLNVLRLWVIVLAANIAGALAFAWVLGNTEVFDPGVKAACAQISQEAMHGGFGVLLLRGIYAGWLIALMVWMLPAAHASRFSVIVLMTYLVGLGGFPHIVAGSVEALYEVTTGQISWWSFIAGYAMPTLMGNVIGGVALVSALNHAQVVAGEKKKE